MAAMPPPAPPPHHSSREQSERAAAAIAQFATQVGEALKQQREQNSAPQSRTGPNLTLVLWMLGVLPIILACLQLMMVARGNMETLRALVQNLNITALVLGTILPLGSTILTWWWFLSFLVKVFRPKAQRKPNWVLQLLILTVVVAFVDFYAMPLFYGAINLSVFAIFVICMVVVLVTPALARRFADEAEKVSAEKLSAGLGRLWAIVFLLGPTLIWLGFLGVWLPQECLTLTTGRIEPAYVLSYDDRWVKYMDGAHVVHIVRAGDVTGRQTLGNTTSTWRKTLYGVVLERSNRGTVPPPPTPSPTTAVPSSPLPSPTTTPPPKTPR